MYPPLRRTPIAHTIRFVNSILVRPRSELFVGLREKGEKGERNVSATENNVSVTKFIGERDTVDFSRLQLTRSI